MFSKFLQHVSNYSIGKLLILMAGVISFPILTRLLPVDQYGMLSLVSTTITFLVAFGKVGLQHSALRFYSDTLERNSRYTFSQFASTTFYGMLAVSAAVTLIWWAFNWIAPDHFWGDGQLRTLFLVTSCLIVLRVLSSAFVNILSAREMSRFVSYYQVICRYAILIAVVITLLCVSQTVLGVFAAQIVVDLFALLFLLSVLYRQYGISTQHCSVPLFRSMTLFGLPMFGFELSGIALSLGDRYVIQWIIGSEALGVYAANYNLCQYASDVVVSAVGLSVLPMYLRIHAEQGPEATVAFIQKSLHIYCLLAFPMVSAVSAMSGDLIGFIASERYVEGAIVIPYVMFGMVLYGAIVMIAPGLYIKKQSAVLMYLVAATAVVNIVLNILAVPHFGLKGAGVATLVSYLLFCSASYLVGRRYFSIEFPVWRVVKVALVALIMYLAMQNVWFFDSSYLLGALFMQGVIGLLVYGILILAVDREARELAESGWHTLRRVLPS